MSEPEFIAYYDDEDAAEEDRSGFYSTINPEGFDFRRPDWATRHDPLRLGPFGTEEEAEQAIDEFLAATGIDIGAMTMAAKHAAETLEADKEHYPGNELAKRRFQVAVNSFAGVCGKGNPPAEVVALTAGSLFLHLCAAYPTAGTEVFRRIGNLLRQSLEIPNIELGETPRYEK